MDSAQRRARAERRQQTAVLNRTTLQRVEPDPFPVSGPDAVSLVEHLTRESWTAAGKPTPTYRRKDTPVRFVRGHAVRHLEDTDVEALAETADASRRT